MDFLHRIVLLLPLVFIAARATADERIEFFERRVRPVLAANCFSCHGEKEQESGLRLDSREAVLKGGDGGAIVAPGQPEQSRLLDAIHWNGDLQMPPERKLAEQEIAAITRWIAEGMAWSEPRGSGGPESWLSHWAFQPIDSPPLPRAENTRWARNGIDQFIVAELQKNGHSPATEADRRTLIRRATFDLHGVPPTSEEIELFLHDTAVDAYERLIDRLLASPRYGERWGRHWLDLARYADTKGYVFFEEKKYPWAYTYRDYVIGALNSDLPYDQFILEQIAADQLLEAGEDKRALAALGFLTVGSHFMNNTHDIIDDRIDVVTRGLMGLTVTCARCHDHKYDPIPTANYYSLYGVFRSCYEPIVPPLFEPPPDTDEYRKFAAEMEVREKKLVDFIRERHAELVSSARTRAGEYLNAAYEMRDNPPTDDFMLLVDQGDLNPTMILRWQVYLAARREGAHPVWGAWHALAELSSGEFAGRAKSVVARYSDSSSESPPINPLVRDALQAASLVSMQDVSQVYGGLLKSIDEQWQAALKVANELKQPPPESLPDAAAEELRQVLYGANSPPDVPLAMDWGFLSLFPDRPTQGEYQKLLKEVEQWMMTGPGAPPRAMVLLDDARPHQPHVFLRGNPHRRGEAVPRRFLSMLDSTASEFQNGSGRLEMARAIADPANPLTARVAVNRLWLHHFGEGLVRTPSDFGIRSQPPSHPELLDWLAHDLVTHGWSFKHMHRLIMTSAVYRQSSIANDFRALSERDPENRLLSFFPRRRLDFEALRDAMLAVADSLDYRMGGPAVELLGDQVVSRRTIYGLIDRMDVPTLLTTFDFPNPLTSSGQRMSTTVAPQALFMMNSPFVAEVSSRVVAQPAVAQTKDPACRIETMFQVCLGRSPKALELQAALDLLGDSPEEEQWRRLAQAIVMSNEFQFVD